MLRLSDIEVRMKPSFLMLLTILLFCISCGKRNASESKRKVRISENQIQAFVENQIVDCASIDGQRCPEGIARLMVLDKNDADESAVCSGFLIDDDKLVTNHHCVSTPEQCKNTFVFIYNGSHYEKTKCSEVLASLNDYKSPNDPRKKIDVSVLKLANRYAGKVFKAASERPLVKEAVTAWVVDHTGIDKEIPNLFESRITEFSCTVAPISRHRSMMLRNCPVIHGNSGSPVLNSKGEVVGVIWGSTAGEEVGKKVTLSQRRTLDEEAAVTEVIHFAQFFNL